MKKILRANDSVACKTITSSMESPCDRKIAKNLIKSTCEQTELVCDGFCFQNPDKTQPKATPILQDSILQDKSRSNTLARSAFALRADDDATRPPESDLITRSDQTVLPLDSADMLDENADVPVRQNPRSRKGSGSVDDSPVVITMPVIGGTYPVTEAACARFRAAYPTLDIDQCLRSILVWLEVNPGKHKTPRGMPRFLAGWMERALNRGHNLLVNGSRSPGGTGAQPVRESLYEQNRRVGEEWIRSMTARNSGRKEGEDHD